MEQKMLGQYLWPVLAAAFLFGLGIRWIVIPFPIRTLIHEPAGFVAEPYR